MKFFHALSRDKSRDKSSATCRWRNTLWAGMVVLSACCAIQAQQGSVPLPAVKRLELPVVLRQKIVAGVTPAGTLVEAKLQIATLVNGAVIPAGAILSGHVEVSAKNEGNNPSRVKIKFDSARWKKETAPLEVYATGAYYPVLRYDNDGGATPNARYGAIDKGASGADDPYPPPPGPRPGKIPEGFGADVPEPIATRVSSHWVRAEGTDAFVDDNGSITVISSTHDLKFDKDTTYLLTNDGPAKH